MRGVAFDPTSKFDSHPAPGVSFHKIGLQGAGSDVSLTHSVLYERIDPTLLHSLSDIVQMLGHEGREIDVLKMDCEGCEHGVINDLACNGHSIHVKQLMVEFHWQKNLGLMNDDDIVIAGDAIQCLEGERWGLVSLEASGIGHNDAIYTDSALKVIKIDGFFAMFATFRRSPLTELLSWQVVKSSVESHFELTLLEEKNGGYGPLYKGNYTSWPLKEQKEYDRLRLLAESNDSTWNTHYSRQMLFDAFEHYEKEL